MGIIAKNFIGNLRLNHGEEVITDKKAGIYHFRRRIEKNVDAILLVILLHLYANDAA